MAIPMPSIKRVRQLALFCADVYFAQLFPSRKPRQEFHADLRQHGVRQDRIDRARAALGFGAAACDQSDDVIIVGERYLARLAHSLCNPPNLELNDSLK